MQVVQVRERPTVGIPTQPHRWFGAGLVVLGAGLIVNSLLGPLVANVLEYPLSETLLNQMIGLEAFSLGIVAPLSVAAGVLALRGHRAAAVIGFGPAAYAVYMLLQYVIGPEYTYYPGVMVLHLGLFVLAGVLTVVGWNAIDGRGLPASTRKTDRFRSFVLFVLAGFLVFRYVPLAFDALAGKPLEAEFLQDVSMFWSIFLLDLGVVLPATLAAAVGLLVGAGWGRKATYALIGWWALVPASVASMGVVMLVNDDPHAVTGRTVVFVVTALLFAAFAVRLYRPLFVRDRE